VLLQSLRLLASGPHTCPALAQCPKQCTQRCSLPSCSLSHVHGSLIFQGAWLPTSWHLSCDPPTTPLDVAETHLQQLRPAGSQQVAHGGQVAHLCSLRCCRGAAQALPPFAWHCPPLQARPRQPSHHGSARHTMAAAWLERPGRAAGISGAKRLLPDSSPGEMVQATAWLACMGGVGSADAVLVALRASELRPAASGKVIVGIADSPWSLPRGRCCSCLAVQASCWCAPGGGVLPAGAPPLNRPMQLSSRTRTSASAVLLLGV
jgi:hypothetical protein